MKKITHNSALSIQNRISSKFKFFGIILVFILLSAKSWAQTNNYLGNFGSTATTLTSAVWSTNPAGPFSSTLNTSGGAIINFNNANTNLTGGALTIKAINATANTVFTNTSGTIQCYNSGILPVDVSSGVLLDISAQGFMNAATNGYIKNGLGIFVLGGNVANGGGVTLNAGTLVTKVANSLGGAAASNVLTLNGGTIATSTDLDFSTKLLRVDIRGDFTFGSNTLPSVASKNLIFGVPVSLGAATRTITIGGTGTYTLGGVISGSSGVGLTVNNTAAGIILLNGANTYDGTTTINGGTLKIGNANALGTSTAGTVINSGGILELNGTNYTTTEPLSIAGTGTSGGALINSTGTATFSGPINLTASTQFAGNAALTLNSTSAISGTGNLTISGGVGSTITSPISITGNIIKGGTGSWTFSGANTYSGTTTVNNGTLKLGASGVIPDASAVSVTTTFDLNGFSETVGSLTGAGTITSSSAGTPVLITGGDNTNTTFSGIIQNGSATTVSLAKVGTGNQTLSGVNTYTGSTTISGGILNLGAAGVIADVSAVSLNGGSLSTGATTGFSETVGTLTLTNNSTIILGTGVHSLTFADSHFISWTSGKTITITGWTGTAAASGTAGKIFVGTNATGLTVDQLAQISFAGYTGAMILNTGEVVPASGAPIAPPTLNADVTANTVDNPIDITFTDNGTYSTAITAVKVGGNALTPTTDYTVTAGTLTLKPAGLNSLLTNSTSAVKAVTIEATGYTVASVSQTIATGAANKLGMKTQPIGPVTNGGVLLTQPAVYILDQYGNKTTSTASVTASVGSGSWTLGGTVAVAAVAGATTFSGLTAASDASVSGATITFSSGTLTTITSTTFNISTPLITLTPASGTTVGGTFDVTFNENATWRGTITGITVGGTTLDPGAYNKTVAGKITFTPSASTLLQSAGTKSIVVSSTGYTDASVSQVIGAGTAAKLGITVQPVPSATTNNVQLTTQPQIAIQDQYGNTVTSSTATVTATLTAGSSTWNLYSNNPTAAVSGISSFSNLRPSSELAVTGAAIIFSSPGLTSVTSNTFSIAAPAATPITLIPSGAATVDASFNITFTNNATWFSNLKSPSSVKVNGTTLTITTDYVLTAGNLQLLPAGGKSVLTTAGSKTITISSNGYAVTSITQQINAGAPAKLAITNQPTAPASNGSVLATQPIIAIQDQYGNVTTSTANVVASVGAGTWTLGGTATVAGVNGTSTFSGLTATSAAAVTGATITFSSGSLTPVTSSAFNIPAPPVVTSTVNASDLGLNTNSVVTVNSGGILTINQATAVNSITVAPGAKINVTVTSIDALTATNGIRLQSSETATATLVDAFTDPTITATVEQYLPQGRNWYIGSPIETNVATTTNITTAGATSVSYYSEQFGWQNSYTDNLAEGVGYVAVSSTGSATNKVNFTGKLNSGNVPITLTRKATGSFAGYNLIANPYPSYINPMPAITANTNLVGTIWYRTRKIVSPYEYKFETVNTTSGVGTNAAGTGMVTGYIPPMQAFWVCTNVDNQPFTFTNSMRDHARNVTVLGQPVPTTTLKAKKQEIQSIARIKVASNTGSDEAVLYFDANASNAYDRYDSPKMFESATSVTPEIYTSAGNEKLVINGLNTVQYDVEIPLGFIAKQVGDYSISKSEMTNFEVGTRIMLKDKLQPTAEIELGEGIVYNFSSTAINSADRFSLIFRSAGTTTGIKATEKINTQVFINAANYVVIVAPLKSNYAIFNAVGILLEKGITNNKLNIINCKLNTGVYFVNISGNGQSNIQKVIIR